VGSVQEDLAAACLDQLQAARPLNGGIAGPAGRVGDRGDAGRPERIHDRIGHGCVGGLVAAAQPDPYRPQQSQVDFDAVAVHCQNRRRLDHGQGSGHSAGTPPDDLERRAGCPGYGQVARMMIAAFSLAIASTVSPSRSTWSRLTFVTAATPPSHA